MKSKLLLLAFIFALKLGAQNACAPKMVLMEESCAINCGPCFEHIVKQFYPFYAQHIDEMAMVVYNHAPIGVGKIGETTKPYDGFYNTFNLEFQSQVLMDRTFFPDNYDNQQGPISEAVQDIVKAYSKLYNADYSPVNVGITNSYNPQTRSVSIKVTANFCDTATGDLRIYLVLTQDTVKGPAGEAYAQYCEGSEDIAKALGYTVTNGQYGSVVESFPFINVVKHQPSGFFGNSGIIPASPVKGVDYTENFSFTLPLKNDPSEAMDIDPKRIQIVAAVVRKGGFKNRQVLNCNKTYLINNTNAIAEPISSGVHFTASLVNEQTAMVSYSTTQPEKVQLHIFNAAGELVQLPSSLESTSGQKSSLINVAHLSNGIYFFSLNVNGNFHTQKVIINR